MTKKSFEDISQRGLIREPRFAGRVPVWKALDAWGTSRTSGLLWIGACAAVYAFLATEWWHYAILPTHFVMGPVHGTIVNWFQNNHLCHPSDPNFARRRFELDPVYPFIRVCHWLGVIRLRSAPPS